MPRPAVLEYVTLLQYLSWYRVARPGREDEATQYGGLVSIITSGDSPAPPGQDTLPLVVRLEDGRVVRRRKEPLILNWGPKGDFETIMMLKVFFSNNFIFLTFLLRPGIA